MEHKNPLITIVTGLATGTGTAVVSLQELDLKLAIVLKIVSISVFVITGAFTLYKFAYLIKRNKAK